MSRFVNTPHGRADPDDPPFTVRTAGTSRPPREPTTAAISAVRALDMSAADHTPGASGSAAAAAEPAPETTTTTPSTPLLFTADMDTNCHRPEAGHDDDQPDAYRYSRHADADHRPG